MSLIYTCDLSGANPFDYLTELRRHAEDVAAHPEQWMPWNYRDNFGWQAARRQLCIIGTLTATESSAESHD
ncbi:MAG: hypothetical protein R3E01_36545 [Pirellulaceae bacterium]